MISLGKSFNRFQWKSIEFGQSAENADDAAGPIFPATFVRHSNRLTRFCSKTNSVERVSRSTSLKLHPKDSRLSIPMHPCLPLIAHVVIAQIIAIIIVNSSSLKAEQTPLFR